MLSMTTQIYRRARMVYHEFDSHVEESQNVTMITTHSVERFHDGVIEM